MDLTQYQTQLFQSVQKKRKRTEKQLIVDEILLVVGRPTKEYSYPFWLKMVKNKNYGEIMSMLKDVANAPANFNKGALLMTKLFKNTKSK